MPTAPARSLTLTLQPDRLAVCRLPAGAPAPPWASGGAFTSVTRSPEETSVVCAEEAVPPDLPCEKGWRRLEIQGPLAFSEIGVLASIAGPLAAAGIGLFVVSTFDTDHLLVKDEDLERAARTLAAAGHSVRDAERTTGSEQAGRREGGPMGRIAIRQASSAEEIGMIRDLFREYARIPGHEACIVALDREQRSLPGEYAPPAGRLLLAMASGPPAGAPAAPGPSGERAAGCAALRPLGDGSCEMKRLYVRPEFRGCGAGRVLVEALLAEARAIGYTTMMLETLPAVMKTAVALYRAIGFRERGPYSPGCVPGALYMEMDVA